MRNIIGREVPGVVYQERMCAYVIPVKDGRFAATRNVKGYFLLGGGIESGETDAQCVDRECMEEIGCHAVVDEFITEAELYCEHRWSDGSIMHMTGRFYTGELGGMDAEPTEEGNELVWLPLFRSDLLRPPHQRLAVRLLAERYNGNKAE